MAPGRGLLAALLSAAATEAASLAVAWRGAGEASISDGSAGELPESARRPAALVALRGGRALGRRHLASAAAGAGEVPSAPQTLKDAVEAVRAGAENPDDLIIVRKATTPPPPYTTTTRTEAPTLRPLAPAETQEVLEATPPTLPPEECKMSDWSEWTACKSRSDDGLKAASRERFRIVIAEGKHGVCGSTEDFAVCKDGGVVSDIRYGLR